MAIKAQASKQTTKITVQQSNKTSSIELGQSNQNLPIELGQSAQHYNNLAKQWAISPNIVENQDYSSKYYAEISKQKTQEIIEQIESGKVVLDELKETKTNSIQELNNQTNSCITSIREVNNECINRIFATSDDAIVQLTSVKTNSIDEIDAVKNSSIDEVVQNKTNALDEIESTSEKEQEELTKIKDEAIQVKQELVQSGMFKFHLFDTKITDRILSYEETFGWALQGTYVYSTAIIGERYGYPNFIERCKKEKSKATATSVTLGSNTLTIYKHSNGHQFYDIADKSKVDAFYNTFGIADFYGIDEENERIFLPRNKYFHQLTDEASKVNQMMEAGLPNHKHYEFGTTGGATGDGDPPNNRLTNSQQVRSAGSSGYGRYILHPDNAQATVGLSSNPIDQTIYGKSTTVQPPSSLKLLYYCVGNTVSDTSWVDVVTQVQGGVKDLEDKKNASIAEIDANAKSYNNLTNRQLTNCLLEVPQRIKLELNNGTLTLKAGSEVIFPNEFEEDGVTPKFDYVTIENDLSISKWGTDVTGICSLGLRKDGEIFKFTTLLPSTLFSGSTKPTPNVGKWWEWYDTVNNKINYTSNNGTSYDSDYCSFPFALIQTKNSVFISIDQIFNGWGYIGSTVWLDKGVKCLIPNGRNDDRTLKNIEVITSNIDLKTVATTANAPNHTLMIGSDGKIKGPTIHPVIYDEINNTNS